MSVNSTEQLRLASQALHAGRFEEAEAICRRVLDVDPRQADAWNCLGLLCFQLQRRELAIDHFRQAAQLRPDEPAFHVNLGELRRIHGLLPDAEASYRRALGLQPQNVVALQGLGIALRRLGRPQESIALFDEALRLKPGSIEALQNRGLALADLKRFGEAVDCFQNAVRLAPQSAELYHELGRVAMLAGQGGRTIEAFRRAIELDPRQVETHNSLGVAYKSQGDFDLAIACYRNALSIEPAHAAAWCNLGNVYSRLARSAEAADAYRQAIAIDPASAEACTSLAATLLMQGATDEAVAALEVSLKLQPDSLRACNIMGTVLKDQGRVDEAVAWLRKAASIDPLSPAAHGSLLCCLNYTPIDPAELLAEHRQAESLYSRNIVRLPPSRSMRNPGRTLRIGYVSADFWRHPVAAFMEPILQCHDRGQFQTFIYSDRASPDQTTQRLRTMVEHSRDAFGWTDAELASQIRADEIDILIELAGHTGQNRLGAVALRPAPIQVSYLGYPSTTGLESIDYRLTDALADPPGEPIQYTEKLWRLAPGFCCYAAVEDAPPVSPLPCLSRPEVTLGAMHHLAKLNGGVLDLWAALLKSLPECRLLVYRDTLHGTAARRLASELTARGVEAHRFELRHTLPAGRSHLSLYDEIDILLDVLPWSGHTTACESLWMGVPVVSLLGNRFAGRMVASVLTLAGLTQWIANDPERYVAIVRRFTAERRQLAELRNELRSRMASSPLCDGATFTRSLEAAYRGMWQRYCAGMPGDAT